MFSLSHLLSFSYKATCSAKLYLCLKYLHKGSKNSLLLFYDICWTAFNTFSFSLDLILSILIIYYSLYAPVLVSFHTCLWVLSLTLLPILLIILFTWVWFLLYLSSGTERKTKQYRTEGHIMVLYRARSVFSRLFLIMPCILFVSLAIESHSPMSSENSL